VILVQLLHIDSSVLGPNSASRALSAEIVARHVALHPGMTVIHRDLAKGGAEGLALGAEAKETAMLKARENIAAVAA
jgi:FMN-dependent NADH-azoreductase